mmetsp:Transcript_35459/g.81105  ORF Transcript_35459/g.81105 Transcript_35459/m.81105 type:complete len:626 (-) Transcript_35459:96-1973(-)
MQKWWQPLFWIACLSSWEVARGHECGAENQRLREELEEVRLELAATKRALEAAQEPRSLGFLQASEAEEASQESRRLHDVEDDDSADEVRVEVTSPFFLTNISLAALCLLMAAFAAGLTMGLVSLEPKDVELIKAQEERDMPNDEEKQRLRDDKIAADKIEPLVHDHHRLLVTLLLLNSIANEALPLFLDKVLPAYAAILFSVMGVLLFGEIIPSAIFTGSRQLQIAAFFSGLVKFAEWALYPVAVPIARILDKALGAEHKGRYNFAELRATLGYHTRLSAGQSMRIKFHSVDDYGLGIITSQQPHALGEDSRVQYDGSCQKLEQGEIYYAKPCPPTMGKRDVGCTFKLYTHPKREQEDLITFNIGELVDGIFETQDRDEVKIIQGVYNISALTAAEVMKPLSQVWMLDNTTKLTHQQLAEIEQKGYSRIPVFDNWPHNIRGYILAKSLIKVTPQDGEKSQTVADIECKELVVEDASINLLDLLNVFQAKRCHLGLIASDPQRVKEAWHKKEPLPCDVHMAGCVTLEDIIEKILGEDIDDEHDGQDRNASVSPIVRKASRAGLAAKGAMRAAHPSQESITKKSAHGDMSVRSTTPAGAFSSPSTGALQVPLLAESGYQQPGLQPS